MFGSLGFSELLIIAAVALVILGPEKFPGQAKIFMRFVRDIRSYWDEAKRDLTDELKPVKMEFKELQKYKPEDYLESMTSDSSEDVSHDAQGYPKPDGAPGAKAEDHPGSSSPDPDSPQERSESTTWKQANETPSDPNGHVPGTEPYSPGSGDVEDPQRYPD